MILQWQDWLIIALSLIVTVLIALYYRKRAEQGFEAFFLGGRNLPWFLAGVSMVATTFAADTPLAVTEIIAKNGVAGNWIWWNFMIGGMITTFFFAHLWRRSGVYTEAQFIELRYHGKAAAWLRGFKAVYLGAFINVLIMGWVCKAMMTIIETFFEVDASQSLIITALLVLFVMVYSNLSGLIGVAVTDSFQFFLAMAGCIALAVLVVRSPEIGGISGLVEKLPPQSLDFFPVISAETSAGTMGLGLWSFVAFFGMMWWASWYPGAEPGGGGYIAQRMMSTKTEQGAFKATLFFQIAHYALRPWPWILVGLAAIVIYPELGPDEKRFGYVMSMRDYLPVGLRGLLLASFLAAFMSTISTQINWGAGYIVNDLWLRFSKKTHSDKQIILGSRITGLLLALLTIAVTGQISTITGVWEFIMQCGAGLGLVLMLRWYWWRVNAWAEIAATVAPFIFYGLIKLLEANINTIAAETAINIETLQFWFTFPGSFFLTVLLTTITWLAVCFLTPAEPEAHLRTFWQKVKPGGVWGKYVALQNEVPGQNLWFVAFAWLSALCMTYGLLFLIGSIILQLELWPLWLAMSAGGMLGTWFFSRKVGLM